MEMMIILIFKWWYDSILQNYEQGHWTGLDGWWWLVSGNINFISLGCLSSFFFTFLIFLSLVVETVEFVFRMSIEIAWILKDFATLLPMQIERLLVLSFLLFVTSFKRKKEKNKKLLMLVMKSDKKSFKVIIKSSFWVLF